MNEVGAWKGAYEEFLWTLVEDGQSVLAEICRLADSLPVCFIDPSKSRFKSILFDFAYFEKTEQSEKIAQQNKDLEDLFYEEHEDLLNKFEQLFNAIANFIEGLLEYCDQRGSEDTSGWRGVDLARELEIESLFILAQALLLIERRLPSRARETLFMAIYRNSDDRSHVEFLVDFLRAKINDADTLFRRLKINPHFVNGVISVFEGGYHQISASTSNWLDRLRPKAPQVLFGCLLFSPKTLNDGNVMRKLVDNFYRDQWVLSLGMGIVVNLFDEWQPYKEAAKMIAQQIDLPKVRALSEEHLRRLAAIEVPQGAIGPAKFQTCIHTITQYNNELRWLVSHSHDIGVGRAGLPYTSAVQRTTHFQTRALRATLKIANFEIEFFKSYRQCLHDKEESAKSLITETGDMIGEIASVFNQGFTSLKVEKKTKLHDWLQMMRKTLEEVDFKEGNGADLAMHIKRRIAQVGEMLDLGGNLAMAQYFERLSLQLDALSAALSVSEKEKVMAERAACPSYAWVISESWSEQIQKLLVESSNTQPVRALFHKLSLAVQTISLDLHSEERKRLIAKAYSCQLENRLRNILQSVPRHLFSLLKTTVIPLLQVHWPPQIDKQQVKELADFDDNFRLAEATYTISNMSVGISRMALTKVGTVDVRPRDLLSEGIRRELRTQLPNVMMITENTLQAALPVLTSSLHSLHAAFLYMCEHVDVQGHEIWRQELSDSLGKFTDEEIGTYLAQKQHPTKKTLYDCSIKQTTVIGVLTQMILAASNPSTTRFLEHEMVWRDNRYNGETLTSNQFNDIEHWVPCAAASCIERLLCTLEQNTINDFVKEIKSLLSNAPPITLDETFFVSRQFEAFQKTVVNNPLLLGLTAKVGQLVLVRSLLLQSRRENGKLRAPALTAALDAANRLALLSLDSPVDMCYLADLLRDAAFIKPSLTRFPVQKTPSHTPLVLFTMLLNAMPKFNGGRSSSICESSFLTGLRCLCVQIGCTQEIVDIARLFNDVKSGVPNRHKQPVHFAQVQQLVERSVS